MKHVPVAPKKSGAVSSANVAYQRDAEILISNSQAYCKIMIFTTWATAAIDSTMILDFVSNYLHYLFNKSQMLRK